MPPIHGARSSCPTGDAGNHVALRVRNATSQVRRRNKFSGRMWSSRIVSPRPSTQRFIFKQARVASLCCNFRRNPGRGFSELCHMTSPVFRSGRIRHSRKEFEVGICFALAFLPMNFIQPEQSLLRFHNRHNSTLPSGNILHCDRNPDLELFLGWNGESTGAHPSLLRRIVCSESLQNPTAKEESNSSSYE